MNLYWKALSISKFGNKEEENDDAFAPYIGRKIFHPKRSFSCAISDGATEAAFSRLWARAITHYVRKSGRKPSRGKLNLALDPARKKWTEQVNSKPLPWFAEEKVRKGSFASLLWLTISTTRDTLEVGGVWKALAIGDSNLFQIRENELVCAFPVKSSREFGNFPFLLPSNSELLRSTWEHVNEMASNWQLGDTFYLMTDALAAWFLSELEKGQNPIPLLAAIADKKTIDFTSWVNQLRSDHEIKNDDTTLIKIKLEES